MTYIYFSFYLHKYGVTCHTTTKECWLSGSVTTSTAVALTDADAIITNATTNYTNILSVTSETFTTTASTGVAAAAT